MIDRKGMFDRKEWEWKTVEDSTLVVCAAPPSGGRATITPRFSTHFNVICMPQATQSILNKIFSSILDGFLKALRDVSKVIQGILMSAPKSIQTADNM